MNEDMPEFRDLFEGSRPLVHAMWHASRDQNVLLIPWRESDQQRAHLKIGVAKTFFALKFTSEDCI